MDTIQTAIHQLRLHQQNDDHFILDIGELVEQEGEEVYPALFQVLANLDLSSDTARTYWHESLKHREQLGRAIGRNMGLISSLEDYLTTNTDHNYTPILIDSSTLSRVLQDSVIDKLTGLNNRALFDQVFEQQLSLAKRYDTELSLLFLDIDNFKEINDRFGHQAGDYALKKVAAIITEQKRDSDIAARFGGEEFILLMHNTNNINSLILGERIRKAVANTEMTFNGSTFSLTISGGLASFPVDGDNSTDILAIADQAVYQAKGAGKNVISLFKKDKRRYLRVKFNNPVFVKELDIDATPTHSGIGKDICIGGILFNNKEPLPIGSKIQIHTKVNQDNDLLLIGTVIRVEAFSPEKYDIGIAISFKEMEKIARNEIACLLRETS